MSYQLNVQGTITAAPSDSAGDLTSTIGIDEQMNLLVQQPIAQFDLQGDAPVVVQLQGMSQFNFLFLKTKNGKVKVTVSSADGATQSWPCDGFLIIRSDSVPFTALTITRAAGVEVLVRGLIGLKA